MPASRRRTWPWVAAVVLAGTPTLPACQGSSDPEPEPIQRPAALGVGSRVLMIGNSLTSANELAGMVEALADSAGLFW